MKLLLIRATGVPDGLADSALRAIAAFNASLDIRLRFLNIGIEPSVVAVAEAAEAAEVVDAALSQSPFDAALLFGGGAAALAAATTVVRSGVLLVRAGAGVRTGPEADASRAIDRLAGVLLPFDAAGTRSLQSEGLHAEAPIGRADDDESGAKLVRGLTAARRRNSC